MSPALRLMLRIMTISLFLVSLNSTSKPVTAVSKPPYGHWWLLNPEAIQPNLIAGGLMICHREDKVSCGDEEIMLVLLEKNTGHGCTDYVGTGMVKQNTDNKQWQIHLVEDGKHSVWATVVETGSNLVLKLADSERILKLEQRKPDDIDKLAKDACDKSLKDFMD